ncbi:MAG: cation:proton antiporter [Acetobacteraceae bacterium]|nr:cation:proton antiporter [Acetobacteraceae bacterium]
MAAPANPEDFKEVLVVLGAAAVVVPLFHRLKLSPVLGFMLVGMAFGPAGLGALAEAWPWLSPFAITRTDHIAPIAELGVVLLLFVIGLEMSFERLKLMRRLVFGLGSLQVCASALAIGGACLLLGLPPLAAVILGLGLAMSSTAVVVQVLAEEKRLNSLAGRAAIAVLLLQDLAVVPILFAVDVLESTGNTAENAGLLHKLAVDLGKAAIAVVVVLVVGRLALRPLFRSVARTGSPELFVAACLLVVLGTGLIVAMAGLSMTLGALIAGLLLAETEYRRQVQVTIEPFKGLLLGVFLISVGMSLSLERIVAAPLFVLTAAIVLVLVKGAIVVLLGRLFGIGWSAGLRAGLLLGPGGEFSLVVTALAVGGGLLENEAADYALVLAALTMAAIPLLSRLGEALLGRRSARFAVPVAEAPPTPDGTRRVIIAGYGRVGRTVAEMLDVHRVPWIALDSDPDLVERERKRGRPVYYGDMTHVDLLHHLDLDHARGVVVTLTDREAADALVIAARKERADLLVVVRARDAEHAAHLYAVGATDAVPETIEASLQVAEAVLVDVGIPMGPVIASIHEKRAEFQRAMRGGVGSEEGRPLGRRRLRDALAAGPRDEV